MRRGHALLTERDAVTQGGVMEIAQTQTLGEGWGTLPPGYVEGEELGLETAHLGGSSLWPPACLLCGLRGASPESHITALNARGY